MNFIDTKVDTHMKWLGLIVLCEVIVIISAMLFYYFIFPDNLISIGVGICITSIPAFLIIRNWENKDA